MEKILFVTVGGSPKPIITAFETLMPDRVVFICSQGRASSSSQVIGKGKPCEIRKNGRIVKKLPNFVSLFKLEDRFDPQSDLVLVGPDDQEECYKEISASIKACKSDNCQLMADYTGGTKSMSVGLAMAAMDYGVELYLTTAARKDWIKVTTGEATERVSTALIDLDRKLEQFLPLYLRQYNYSAAIEQLKGLLRSAPLSASHKQKLRRLIELCSALESWDQFSHEEAWQALSGHLDNPVFKQLGLYLKRIIQSRADIDEDFATVNGIKGHGFEIVEDLVMNAARRAAQKKYDDAVGRLYRALELLAQVHLARKYGIKTGDADIQKIPPAHRPEYEAQRFPNNENKIMLGLKQAYLLLEKFENDPLGTLYREHQKKIDEVLVKRNNSLFAHGFQPITAEAYEALSEQVVSFIKAALERLGPKGPLPQFLQFPDKLF